MMHELERRVLFAVVLDPTFGVAGRVNNALEPDPEGFSNNIAFIQELGNGNIVIGGIVFPGGEPAVRAARFTAGGLRDTTFDGDGLSPVIDMPISGSPAGGAVQSDGKVLVGSSRQNGLAVVRFNANGSLDTAFGGGDGIAQAPNSGDGIMAAADMALADDGKIVIAGRSDASTDIFIARFNTDGTLDTSFDDDGTAVISADTSPLAVEALADGKILMLGQGASDAALVRLNADGSLDTTFNSDGIARFSLSDIPGSGIQSMLLDGDTIVVGGMIHSGGESSTNQAVIARFHATDGSFDTTFGGGDGISATGDDGGVIVGLTIDNEGRYLGSRATGEIVRWSSSGVPDATFGPGGETDGVNFSAGPLFVNADGEIVYTDQQNLYRLTDLARPQLELGDNGTLIITNDTGNNTINIVQSGANVAVTRNGVTTNFPAADVLGFDILTGDGNDTVAISVDGNALVILGDGANTLTLGDGSHTITGGSGADDITTGDGDTTVVAGAGDDTIVLGDGQNFVNGQVGDDSVTTGDGRAYVEGDDGDDTISTGAGSDILVGGRGSDSLSGGAGDDEIYALFSGGPGGSLGDDDADNVLHGGDGRDYMIGSSGRDSMYGGAQNDVLISNAGSDLLSGGGGNDRLGSGGGPDRLYGGPGKDQLDGGNHNDRIFGQGGDDKLFGGRGIDTLTGEAGDDLFFTFDGNADQVDGGSGNNVAALFDEVDEILNATNSV